MNSLQVELITALWDGARSGDELFAVFSATVGDRQISFKEVVTELETKGWIQIDGRDMSGDEIYVVTENGSDECGKYLYGAEVGKGGKFRKKTRVHGGSTVTKSTYQEKKRSTAEQCFWFFMVWILAPTCGVYIVAWWIKELSTAN